jgi:hypothetical protein
VTKPNPYNYSPEDLALGELDEDGVLVLDVSTMTFDQAVYYYMTRHGAHEYNAQKWSMRYERARATYREKEEGG